MNKFISKLDSDRFGIKIAKVDDFIEAPIKLINDFKQDGVKLVISRAKSSDINLINQLEEIGFQIKDTQLKYKYEIKDGLFSNLNSTNELLIRDFQKNDLNKIIKITEESFFGYGHYFADSRLEVSKCMEVYKDWIKRSCLETAVADKVFVAEKNNELLGYLTFKIHDEKTIKYAVGGIGAVSKKYRNLGVFPSIAKKSLLWGIENKQSWQEHNVLTTNYAVNRAFSKIGFRIVESYITFHYWVH